MIDATLLSIQVGMPQSLGSAEAANPMNRPWTSGIYKSPVEGRIWLGKTNLVGDGQADLKVHGGPDKAVNIYPSEHYQHWLAELKIESVPFGAFGENFTTQGLLEENVCIGDVYSIDEVVVQVSQPRQPCWKLARRWGLKDFAARVEAAGLTGWYFRVLQEGSVEAGAELKLLERPYPEWTIATANLIMTGRNEDVAARKSLSECSALSASWRRSLQRPAVT